MLSTRLKQLVATACAVAFAHLSCAQDKMQQFPFTPFPISVPFIPLAPQPESVPANTEGWRAIVSEFGPPVKGSQTKIVDDVVAELSRGAGYVAPKGGYRGTLIDTSILNAFAIGDGNVFVTRQLLAFMNDEDELIGVLGHEVGHVVGGHSRFNGVANAAQLGEDRLLGVFLPPVRGIAQVGSTLTIRGFNRAQEHSADVAGVKFLADLGRDPNAMGRALSILGAESKLQSKMYGGQPPSAFDYWLNDHPIQSERMALVQLAANMSPRGWARPHRSREAFIRELDGLMFDDSPDQGIIDGGKFRHPVLKFGLDAPPSFRLLNGTTALLLKAPGGSSATLKMVNGGGSPAERFKVAWTKAFPPEIAPPSPELGSIGGLASASGYADKRVNDVTVRISMWLYQWSETQSFIYAAVDRTGADISGHLAAARSFRRLSEDEARSVQVRRLSVVDIKQSDTIAELSRRMAYSDFREERFRLINGLFNGEALPKSGPVKVVVWAPQ